MNIRPTFLRHCGPLGRRLYYRLRRMSLRNRSVSIISNNCWGGFICKRYGLPFNTPFIGLFIMADDYLRLLEDRSLLYGPMRFISSRDSRYAGIIEQRDYPVGILADDIEVHFLHYKSEEEARQKWSRRVKRIDWDNAVVKFSENTLATPDHLRRFDRLPFAEKVCFTRRECPDIESAVSLPECASGDEVASCWKFSDFHWDFVDHANTLLR